MSTPQLSFVSQKNAFSHNLHDTLQQQQQQQQFYQKQQQFQQQISNLPQFLVATFQNMAASAAYANCKNQFQNRKLKNNF